MAKKQNAFSCVSAILRNFRYRRQISKIRRRRESRGQSPLVYFFGIFFRTAEKSTFRSLPMGVMRACKPSAYFFGTFFRTSEKSAAAMCRFNFREQARENNKLNLSRKHARLTAINSSSQTQSNAEPPFN